MAGFGREIEPPAELLSESDPEPAFPEFDAPPSEPKQSLSGFIWIALMLIAGGVVIGGGMALHSSPEAEFSVLCDLDSVLVAKSGDEFRYCFTFESDEDLALRGTLTLSLLTDDGSLVERKTFDLNNEPLEPTEKRRLVIDSKTNRAGRDGFSGASGFRWRLVAEGFRETEGNGELSTKVLDWDAFQRLNSLFDEQHRPKSPAQKKK